MPRRRSRGEGLVFRLFLGMVLSLLACGFASYALMGDRVRANLLDEGERSLQQEAEAFEHALGMQGATRTRLRRFARSLPGRGEFAQVAILDDGGSLIAGKVTAARDDALRTTFRSGDHKYTLVAQLDESRLEDLLVALRDSMAVLALPALLGSLLVFWLLAGRSVQLRHRYALERATSDGLTGLGNHRAFQEEVERAVALADRTDIEVSLAVFDIDDFKFLNDRRGHQYGDGVLRRAAEILGMSRVQDRAFRTGGDEFALLMPGTAERDGHSAAIRLCRLMGDDGIAASCGISATRPGERSAAVLRQEAEAALQEAKRRRAAVPLKFSAVESSATILTPQKIHQLRLMIEHCAVDAALQPIWDIVEGRLIGLEGLARPHADYGMAGPAEAFDVAEEIGRIGDLDRLCVQRILEHAADLPRGARLFINVHPSSLDDGEDGHWLLETLRTARVATSDVVIEVTERTGARVSALVRSVRWLRALGFKVALDDVGAGNSGLELMRLVPVDFLKVDRTIVARAPVDRNARAALAAVAAFAHETGTYVIAEGIEDPDGLHFLRGLTVHAPTAIRGGQGYGLGRPVASVGEAVSSGRRLLAKATGATEGAGQPAQMPMDPAPGRPWPVRSGA